MVEVSLRRTGNQVHKILEISPVSHRQVLRLSGGEVCPGLRAIGLQRGKGSFHSYRLVDGPRLQSEIDVSRSAHRKFHIGSHHSLEAGLFCRHLINARRHIRKRVKAAVVGRCRAAHVLILLCDGNLGARHGRSGRISDRAQKGAIHRLAHDLSGAHRQD